jgi:hypothetical protein|tara:strand:- start:116 stop:379 length:264 start_codon:yes stop_codon:yes gene_type:complete
MIMADVTMSLEEYETMRAMILNPNQSVASAQSEIPATPKKRKASAYSKRYGRAFKKVQGQYKLKSGAWAKNGFKRAQKAAHALAKKK